jgi:hypothetical protein
LQLQALEGIEVLTIALHTRVLRWAEAETQILNGMARNEFKDQSKHLYLVYHIIYGRKPEESKSDGRGMMIGEEG